MLPSASVPTARARAPRAELAWLATALLATAGTFVTAGNPLLDAVLLLVALTPWLLDAAGRTLPRWLFAALGILPVVALQTLDGLNASIFLVTTACCRFASEATRTRQLVGIALIGVVVPFTSVASGREFDRGTLYFVIGNLFGTAVGMLIGHARRLGAELRIADARLLEVAAREERARLARDVHDLVAHSLTVVVLQVGGARRILHTRPAEAQTALEQAERVCRESLDGVREVVGLLRSDDDTPTVATELPHLVQTYRDAGVTVELDLDDRAQELSLLVRGTVYRVVQEALANASRYRTPGTPVTVEVDVDVEGVTVRVANADAAVPRTGPGGYGLRGLQEQVSRIGGRLTSGPADGRWLVECRLPRTVSAGRVAEVAP